MLGFDPLSSAPISALPGGQAIAIALTQVNAAGSVGSLGEGESDALTYVTGIGSVGAVTPIVVQGSVPTQIGLGFSFIRLGGLNQ